MGATFNMSKKPEETRKVSTRDPFTMSVIPLTIAAVGCLACCFPARRATRLDPMIALRSD